MSATTILITGSAGWLGGIVSIGGTSRRTGRLPSSPQLSKAIIEDGKTPNPQFILAVIVEPKPPQGVKSVTIKADLTNREEIDKLFNTELGIPDVIYCLHGIMSRGSEDNFDLGVKVNIDSIRYMLEAARKYGEKRGAPIKFIFTSSLAVYGGPLVSAEQFAREEEVY